MVWFGVSHARLCFHVARRDGPQAIMSPIGMIVIVLGRTGAVKHGDGKENEKGRAGDGRSREAEEVVGSGEGSGEAEAFLDTHGGVRMSAGFGRVACPRLCVGMQISWRRLCN